MTEYFTPMRTHSNCGTARKKRRRRPHSTKHSAIDNGSQSCTSNEGGDLEISEDAKISVRSDSVEKNSDVAAQSKLTGTSRRTDSSTSNVVMFAGRIWERKRTAKQIFIRGDNVVSVIPKSVPEHE